MANGMTPPMGKEKTEKKGDWNTTGNAHMYGWRGTGTQQPGQSAQEGTGGKREGTAKGGGEKAFVSSGASNKDFAGTATSETTGGPTKSGSNDKFACGGTTKMFGNRGSQRAEPA